MAINYIQKARDLVKNFSTNAGTNLKAWKQVATNPQLRQDYTSNVVKPAVQKAGNFFVKNAPMQQPIIKQGQSNLATNVRILSNPQSAQEFQQGFNNTPYGFLGRTFINNYVAPVAQIPYRAKEFASGIKNKNLGQVASGGLGVVGGVASLIPGVDDLIYGGYNLAKGYNQNYRNDPNVLRSLKSGLKTVSGEKQVGLGEALGGSDKVQNALNLAEFPLMVAGMRKTPKYNFNRTQISDMMGALTDKQAVKDMQTFATLIETKKGADQIPFLSKKYIKKYEGLGPRIREMAKELFGNEVGNELTNKQLKNALDALAQEANRASNMKPFIRRIQLGLSTDNIRKNQVEGIPKPPTGGLGVKTTLPEVSPEVKTAGTQPKESLQFPQSPPIGSKKSGDFQNPSDPFYNINRIGVKTSTKEAIKANVVSDEVAKKISDATGGKLSFDEVKAGAEVSKELDKVFTREDTVKLGREALALRNKVAQLSEINATDEQFNDALIKDKAFGQFLARLLGQRRIISDPTKKTMYNEVIGKILKTGVDPEELTKAAKGVDFTDSKQLAEFYRQYIKATPGELIDKLRYSSMLSSPNTWINNAVSNYQGTGILQPIQKTIEGGIDSIVSGLTGKERTRFAGEGPEYFKGYYGSVKEGYKKMLDSFSGKLMNENPDVRYIPTLKGGKVGQTVEKVFEVPAKIQEGVDQFFKALTKGGLEKSYKYRLDKGVKTGISKDAVKEANDLLFRGKLTEKGAGAVSNFVGSGAKWVKNATYSENRAFRWMAKLTFPFVNTGTNLAKAGLEGNPLTGLINMKGNEDKIAQTAKMVMGGTVMAIGTSFALNDRLSFGEDTYNRDAQREAGFQPYSMKIGDKWVSYSKMHPLIGFQLATVAAIADAFKKSKISEDTSEIIAQGLFDSLKFYADQTYFKNIGDFVDTVKGADVESLTRFASNYPSQFIPFRAMMGWITRIVDEYQRKPDTKADFFTKSFQQIATQIPGLSTMVPKREGPSGEPITMPLKDRLINAVSPAKYTTENKEGKYVYEFETNALRAWKNYKVLKEKDPEAAKLYSNKMKKDRPQFYSQLKKLKEDETLKITKDEQNIRSLDVQKRARAVAKELSKLENGSQERKALQDRYKELGIITDDVYKQLLEMKKRGDF